MDRNLWDNSVTLLMEGGTRVLIVRSPNEARNLLFGKWPVFSGKAYLRALTACVDVADGLRKPEEAYRAFIEAAREAGIPIMK